MILKSIRSRLKEPLNAAAVEANVACYHVETGPPTSDGAEGVDVFGGEQGSGQLPDELLQQRGSIVGAHVVPAEVSRVETGFQLLLQQLQL